VLLAVGAAGILLPSAIEAQLLPSDPAERARVVAQIFEANASELTIFDRRGAEVARVGSRDLHGRPTLSPDGKRIAVIKNDVDKETSDLWIVNVDGGAATRLTTSETREGVQGAAWSPDGSEIAYSALREGYFGLYRQPATGGTEELLYRGSAPLTLTEWSLDGRYLGYFSTDLTGGALYALPLHGANDREPLEIFRSEKQAQGVHFSPDSRYVSYVSNDTGRNEIYVRRFDPGASADVSQQPQRVSNDGAQGLAFWRQDGTELYYLAADRSIMAVPVTPTSEGLAFGRPTALFRAPDALQLAPGNTSISSDGAHIVVAVPPPVLRELTVLDREGNVVTKVGDTGAYVQPNVSPDGTRVVLMNNDRETGSLDIWTVDLASGKRTAITRNDWPEFAPIWSPDGRDVAYVSMRDSYAGIYRKAADGTGEEELLFRYTPGAGMVLTDWSPDGRFLTFHTGVLVLVPLTAAADPLQRKEIDWLREDYDVLQGRFSPDGRFIAYLSNEADPDRAEVYVRPFDAAKPDAPPAGSAVRVSKDGALGMVNWRGDGKQLYFLSRDWEVMAVDVTLEPAPQAGDPRVLFKLNGPLPGNPSQWKNVSPDGERFVFAMPAAAARR
jgi:Tol biopolymer transport system component